MAKEGACLPFHGFDFLHLAALGTGHKGNTSKGALLWGPWRRALAAVSGGIIIPIPSVIAFFYFREFLCGRVFEAAAGKGSKERAWRPSGVWCGGGGSAEAAVNVLP